jgi:spermidine/putrescine ABC transporter ATP-binding subunit
MAIEIKNVSKHYGDVRALHNFSLLIDDKEFVTLLGPSGCGKTTLLKIVGGLIEPDEGEVIIDGKLVNHLPANKRPTGMVFQSYALFPHMTVEKNISFGLRMQDKPKDMIEDKVHEVAELVGIEQMLDRFPKQLSGGQRQRVALARTLAIEPDALLLDEPLAALDRKLRVNMQTEIRKLVIKLGITTIYVTHDQQEALTMSDRIAVMNRGEVAQYGTPMEIYDKPANKFVAGFIGESNIFYGKVEQEEDGQLVFHGNGIDFPFPATFDEYTGQKINLLLRPEHLGLRNIEDVDKSEELGVPGVITFKILTGDTMEYEVKLDSGASLDIEIPRSRGQFPFSDGTRIWLYPKDIDSYFVIHD